MRNVILVSALFAFNCFGQVENNTKPIPVTYEQDTTDYTKPVNGIYERPEVDAEFKGGVSAMMRFLQMNIRYPNKAIENEEQGKIYLSFIVDKKGRVSDVKVIRGVSPELDREAKRVVSIMPRWRPARVKGKKVKSLNRIPIVFTLD